MSIQPLSNSSPAAEPAVQRGRAAQSEAARGGEVFALPDAPMAQATSASALTGAAAGPAMKTAGVGQGTAAEPQAAEGAAKAVEAASPPPPVAARPDPGALVTLAAAEQGEVPAAVEAVSSNETELPGPGDAGIAGEVAPEIVIAPGAAPVEAASPAGASIVPMPPGPAMALPDHRGAAAEAAPAGSTATIIGGAGGPAFQPQQVGSQMPAAPLPPGAAAIAGTQAEGLASVKPEQVPQAGLAGKQAVAEAGETGGADPVQASSAASPLASFKALEAMQPAQNPIDLSALAHQAVPGAETGRGLAALEQPAATPSAGPGGQSASGGQPTPLHVVPIEIGLRALAGARQFDIRLDPGELGRVDVNLSISDEGEINARLVVDRVETLHLLQRDARTLERAFEQAGLKPSDGGVEITLRDPADQSGSRQNRQQEEALRRDGIGADAPDGDAPPQPAEPVATRRLVRLGGVDLSI